MLGNDLVTEYTRNRVLSIMELISEDNIKELINT